MSNKLEKIKHEIRKEQDVFVNILSKQEDWCGPGAAILENRARTEVLRRIMFGQPTKQKELF